MESPVTIVKSAFNVSLILKTAVVVLIIMAIAEATGFTSWILSPVASWRNRAAK